MKFPDDPAFSREPRPRFAPRDVIEIGKSDPRVQYAITAWERGDLSWEQALMACVVMLAEHNRELTKDAIKAHLMTIPAAVQVGGEVHEYIGPCPLCNQNVDPMKLKRKGRA